MALWKRFVFVLAGAGLAMLAVLALNPSFEQSVQVAHAVVWETFSPQNNKFAIQMPSAPQESHERIVVAGKKIDFHELSTEANNATYTVTYLNFPSYWKLLGANKMLKKSFAKMIENEGNVERVLSQGVSTYDGHPSFSYVYQRGGDELSGRFIVVGNTLYRLSVSYPQDTREKAAPDVFLDSFCLNT